MTTIKSDDAGKHYRFQLTVKVDKADAHKGYKIINLDPFRIAAIYGIKDFALNTILKKVLVTGNRGHKDERQDLLDIISAAERKLQMMSEDTHVFYDPSELPKEDT